MNSLERIVRYKMPDLAVGFVLSGVAMTVFGVRALDHTLASSVAWGFGLSFAVTCAYAFAWVLHAETAIMREMLREDTGP